MADWLLLKRGLYYRPEDCGYTGIRDHAGRYTEDEAKVRVGHGVTAIRLEDAPEFTDACFDDLAREHLTKQRDEARAALKRVLADIADYERVNNLAPNPGRQYCWDSVAHAHAVMNIHDRADPARCRETKRGET